MRSKDDPDLDDQLEEVGKEVTQYLEVKEQWYDPAIGPLPEWVPAPIKTRYTTIWDRLAQPYCEKPGIYSYEQVRALIKRYKHLGKDGVEWEWIGIEPHKLFDDIGFVANVEYAVSIGEYEGIKELAGDDAWRGRKTINGARHSRDHKKDLARWTAYLATVGEIHRRNPRRSNDRVFKVAADRHDVSKKTIERAHKQNKKERFTQDPFS